MKAITGRTPTIRARRQRVAQLYATTPCSQIAKELGVPRSTVEGDCTALGLRKSAAQRAQSRKGLLWDGAHIEILTLMRPVMVVRDIAALLGRPEKSVGYKADLLGLKKEKPIKPAKAPKAPKPPVARAPKESVTKPVAAPVYRGPPPMTAAQRAQREKLRITYAPDKLPWRAQMMLRPASGLPDLSHRSR